MTSRRKLKKEIWTEPLKRRSSWQGTSLRDTSLRGKKYRLSIKSPPKQSPLSLAGIHKKYFTLEFIWDIILTS